MRRTFITPFDRGDIGVEATRIGALCERITEIEGRADDIHNEGLHKLYQARARSDPMAFVTGKEIYDHLETVVDCFDDIGNESRASFSNRRERAVDRGTGTTG